MEIRFILLRTYVNYGLGYYKDALDDGYASHEIDGKRIEPMVLIPTSLCAMSDPKSAVIFLKKIRKKPRLFRSLSSLISSRTINAFRSE